MNVQRVLGIDLASGVWSDNGSALLSFCPGQPPEWREVRYGVIRWPDRPLSAEAMASAIDAFVRQEGIHAVGLDGPQGWREPDVSGRPGVGRWCEYQARTQGKSGVYGIGYPATQLGWMRFCMEVFERLLTRAHARLLNDPSQTRVSVLKPGSFWLAECFPTSTWRTSGLEPLPAKQRTIPAQVARWAKSLWKHYDLPASGKWRGSHDDLQAVVAALPVAGLLGGPSSPHPHGKEGSQIKANGATPRHRVEGLIWDCGPIANSLPFTAEDSQSDAEEDARTIDSRANNPLLIDERDDAGERCLQRGVQLFRQLVALADAGESVGVSYAQFVCCLHGVSRYDQAVGRNYGRADTPFVLQLAKQVTDAAGGRQAVARYGVTIRLGMDSFIWRKDRPYPRPPAAFGSTSYTEADWKIVFPDGARRLLQPEEYCWRP
jgi:hypothetical protein